jgi:hypothetical protein
MRHRRQRARARRPQARSESDDKGEGVLRLGLQGVEWHGRISCSCGCCLCCLSWSIWALLGCWPIDARPTRCRQVGPPVRVACIACIASCCGCLRDNAARPGPRRATNLITGSVAGNVERWKRPARLCVAHMLVLCLTFASHDPPRPRLSDAKLKHPDI